jgi:hypothetical protein
MTGTGLGKKKIGIIILSMTPIASGVNEFSGLESPYNNNPHPSLLII